MCTKGVSAKYRPILSTDMSVATRSLLGRYSVDTRSIHRLSIDRHIGRYLADTTFSTHDAKKTWKSA